MKILHITETARGGVGTYIGLLANFSERSAEVRIVLPDCHAEMVQSTAPRRTFFYKGRSLRSVVLMISAAIKERFLFKPDIIFCHSTFSLFALLVLRPLSPKAKFIYCAHGWAGAREMDGRLGSILVRWIEGTVCGLAHRIVNCSESDFDFALDGRYRGHHVIIENAVRPPRENILPAPLEGPPDAIHLLFVGRLDRQKGLDILLEAFSRARKNCSNLHLHIVGEAVLAGGPDTLPDLANVHFLGWVSSDRIDEFYCAADLVVLPSRWEGLPLVLLEALRNGRPVLVSDRSGLPGLVTAGIDGLVAPLGVTEWADTLVSLDKNQLISMRPAARELFGRRYVSDRLQKDLARLFAELIEA